MNAAVTIQLPKRTAQQLLWFREGEDEALADVIGRLVADRLACLPQEHPNFERAPWPSQELHMWLVMFVTDCLCDVITWVTRDSLAFGAPRKFAAITGIGLRRPALTVELRGNPGRFQDRSNWLRPASRPGWSRFTFSDPPHLRHAENLVAQAYRLSRAAP